jgi:hypothetical protein
MFVDTADVGRAVLLGPAADADAEMEVLITVISDPSIVLIQDVLMPTLRVVRVVLLHRLLHHLQRLHLHQLVRQVFGKRFVIIAVITGVPRGQVAIQDG